MKSRKGKTNNLNDGMLGPALQRYFCQYLMQQRELSPRTIAAYRDTFKLLLAFFERCYKRKPDNLCVRDLDANCILAFLNDLERHRHNGARSRNARLAAIRSFVRHAAASDPLLLPIAQKVLSIPIKRFERNTVGHLTRRQMQLLLDTPDTAKRTGLRDCVLLTLMYNTGARVSEIAALKVDDLSLEAAASIRIRGKGRKQRAVPLWRKTAKLLRGWMLQTSSEPEAPLLPNALGEHMTRSGIESRLRGIVRRATTQDPSLGKLRVSPHIIRHTTAMHLLQSGVDLSVIAMWLGHESIQTTHQYLNADIDSKRRALERMDAPAIQRSKAPKPQPLVAFLSGL